MMEQRRSSFAASIARLRARPQKNSLLLAGIVGLLVAAVGWFIFTRESDDITTTNQWPTTTVPTTTSVPETTTTTSPWNAEEQEAVDAYHAAMEAGIEAAAPPEPNPDHPDIERTHTGDELAERVASIERLVSNGSARQFPEESVYTIDIRDVWFDRVDGVAVAYLDVCTVNDIEEVVLATGDVLSRTKGIKTSEVTATMERIDGAWKLAGGQIHERHEGEAECSFD